MDKIVATFDLIHGAKASTLLSASVQLQPYNGTPTRQQIFNFQRCVGFLIYPAVYT